MTNDVDGTLARLVARGGPCFHEIAPGRGPITVLKRLLGLPSNTHYYERIDGSRVLLTAEETSEIAPIELEMFSKKAARRMMLERRARRAA
jgi:hypothetical protein